MQIPKRSLGGLEVGALGYGAMGLEGYYGGIDERNAIATLRHALDAGIDLLDTADAYGSGRNETLVGRAIADRRADATVATKIGIVFEPGENGTDLPTGWGFSLPINGRPEYVARAIDRSLRRLGVDVIDLLYLHYPDPAVPIEESAEAMARAVIAGKVRHLGLSNVTADEVRRAHGVHPIAAVQYEYSLWRREAERDLIPALRDLGVGLVPWSPLGAGFLTGGVASLPEGDFRRNNPKLTGDNLNSNLDRFAPLRGIAAECGLTPAQLALAWLLHRGPDVVPIPGTRRPEHIDENVAATRATLDEDVLLRIDAVAPLGAAVGQTLV